MSSIFISNRKFFLIFLIVVFKLSFGLENSSKNESNVSNPRVSVLGGILEGKMVTSIGGTSFFSFLGIPYAEPPIGNLRFHDPVPKKSWSNIYDAKSEGDECLQLAFHSEEILGSEDCLYLNVHTPKLSDETPEGSKFPVMVYIHGGGFFQGSGSLDHFGPDFIVESGTILVSINYRLSVFGFLSLDIPEVSGNAALKDQNMALKWIKDNIGAFNGDPENITIFGISAGSASIEFHLVSKMSKNLFQKGILQSGSLFNPCGMQRHYKKNNQKLKTALNITQTETKDVLNRLQQTDSKVLLQVSQSMTDVEDTKNAQIFTFGPVVEKRFDGVAQFLDEDPIESFKRGDFQKLPTMSGFCENEGFFFREYYDFNKSDIWKGNFVDYIPKFFNIDRLKYDEILRAVYNDTDEKINIEAFLSDLLITSGLNETTKKLSQYGDNYFYTFAYNGNINYFKAVVNANETMALHSDEVSYLATSIIINEDDASDQDKQVRKQMVKLWTNFAKTGNPTPVMDDLIGLKWKPLDSSNVRLLNISTNLNIISLPYPERIHLWEDIYNSYKSTFNE